MANQPLPTYRLPLRATLAGFRRFSVAEYHKLIEHGILTENDHLELLDGYLVEKMPHDPIHDGTIQLVEDALRTVLPSGWCLRIQSSLTLSRSEPEPDLVIARGDKRTYLHRHPVATDIALIVEVSNTSLESDRDDKLPIYAAENIPVYWIVNLIDYQIEVYEQPSGPSLSPIYGTHRTYKRGDLVPLQLPGTAPATVPVNDLLP
ncbi:MAG: Uma2 family endonuclease [Gemmataceae bacterium]|nr:Uma2 family endonuclease [Gemmata sp.]MDW8196815.1 Uma2 family endonuclease [Gemmataceae bacterium]